MSQATGDETSVSSTSGQNNEKCLSPYMSSFLLNCNIGSVIDEAGPSNLPHTGIRMTGDSFPVCKITDTFTLEEQIGSGSFANVYKAIEKATKKTIAIKSYRMRKKDLCHFPRAATEIAFIRFLKHPNIIGYILADIKRQYMYLGIEYSGYGSLMNFMYQKVGLTQATIQQVMRQLISAICYLHSMSIFHGDIKPENIIVTDIKYDNLIIKLSDFGLANVILKNQPEDKKCGSFYYMAPEILLGFPYDHKSDLFSAGVVMYEMIFSQKPLNTRISKAQYILLLRRRVEIPFPFFELDFLSYSCIDLVKNLLSYDKRLRLFGEALARHPFLNIPLVKDEQNHYMIACERLMKGVDLVNRQEFGAGYIEITEAILHMKIYINRIQDDDGLREYMMCRYKEYMKYCEKIEQKLVSDRRPDPIEIQTNSEKLRYLLQSTPALMTGYDMCSVGEMFYLQSNFVRGPQLIKQGLDMLFPLLLQEPDGLRKQLLYMKLDHWMKILELLLKGNEDIAVPINNAVSFI